MAFIKKQTAKSEQKRNLILEEAWKILSREGYERTSMDSVVAATGGSKATLYKHFKSKEELVSEAAFRRAKELSDEVFKDFNDDDFDGTLRAFATRHLNFYMNSDLIEVYRLATAEGNNLKLGAILFEEAFKVNWQKLAKYLERHIKQKYLFPGGTWTACMHLKGILDSEILIKRAWGAVESVSDQEIEQIVNTGIDAFLRIYTSKK